MGHKVNAKSFRLRNLWNVFWDFKNVNLSRENFACNLQLSDYIIRFCLAKKFFVFNLNILRNLNTFYIFFDLFFFGKFFVPFFKKKKKVKKKKKIYKFLQNYLKKNKFKKINISGKSFFIGRKNLKLLFINLKKRNMNSFTFINKYTNINIIKKKTKLIKKQNNYRSLTLDKSKAKLLQSLKFRLFLYSFFDFYKNGVLSLKFKLFINNYNYYKAFKKAKLKPVFLNFRFIKFFKYSKLLQYLVFTSVNKVSGYLAVRGLVFLIRKNTKKLWQILRIFNYFFSYFLRNQKFLQGYKIEVRGVLGIKRRKKVYRSQKGRVPVSSRNEFIDYNFGKVVTRNGVFGIRLWLNFRNEFYYDKRFLNLKNIFNINELHTKKNKI